MPTRTTKKNAAKGRREPGRVAIAAVGRARLSRTSHKTVDVVHPRTGETTAHVLIPLVEYERMLEELDKGELISRLESPQSEWVGDEESRLIVAGGELAAARKRAGLTQKQLGDRMGVPQSQISRMESNPDRTTVRSMKRIAKALGVDIGSLLG